MDKNKKKPQTLLHALNTLQNSMQQQQRGTGGEGAENSYSTSPMAGNAKKDARIKLRNMEWGGRVIKSVTVSAISGGSYEVNLAKDETVESLKNKVRILMGVKPGQTVDLYLSPDNTPIKVDSTLEGQRVDDGAELSVVVNINIHELFDLMELAVECYEDELRFTDDMIAKLKTLVREAAPPETIFSPHFEFSLKHFKAVSPDAVRFLVDAINTQTNIEWLGLPVIYYKNGTMNIW